MPEKIIPLSGNPTTRGWSTTTPYTKDQILKGVVSQVVPDSIKGDASYFLQKRAGLSVSDAAISSNICTSLIVTSPYIGIAGVGISKKVVSIGGSTSTVYYAENSVVTNCGTTSVSGTGYVVRHTTELVFGGITYWMLSAVRASVGIPIQTTGWYVASDAIAASTTFTGNRTSGSPIITSVSSIAGLHVGQLLNGTGFSSPRILSIDSATQITLNQTAVSGSGTNTTFTREHIAQIINTNFPANITGAFQELDGRVYIMDTSGNVCGSNSNDVDTWTLTNKFVCNSYTDGGIGLAKWKNLLLAFGQNSCEFLENTGNSSGSLLSRRQVLNVGARVSQKNPFRALISNAFDTVGWVTRDMLPKSYLWDGELKDVSFPDFSTLFSGWTNYVTWQTSMVSQMGQHFFCVSASTSSPAYINQFYSLESKQWVDQNFSDSMLFEESTNALGFCVESTLTNGNIYYLDGGIYQDNSQNFTLTVQLEPQSLNNGAPFTINSVELIGDIQSSGSTTYNASSDDGQNFTNVGSFDMTSQRKLIAKPRYYKSSWQPQLTHSANTSWRAQAIKIRWEPAVI